MSQYSGSWPWQWEPQSWQSWHYPSASSSDPGHTGQRWHPNPNNPAEVRLRHAMDQKWEREKRRRQKRREEKGHGKGQDDPLAPGDDPAPEQNKDNENKQKEPPLSKPAPKLMPVKQTKAEVPQCKPEPKKMPVDRQVQPKVAKTEPEENMEKDKKRCQGQAASDTCEDLWREGEKWAEEETMKLQEAEKWAEEETVQWLNERYAFWVDCMEWADEETKIWLAQNLSPNGIEQNMVRNTYSVRLSPAFICDQRLMRGQLKQSIHCSMINQSSFVEGLCGAVFCSQSTIVSQGGPPARASQSNT